MWPIVEIDISNFETPILMFKWALTVIGTGIFLVGLIMFFSGLRENTNRSSYGARLTALISFGIIGTGTVLYSWIWFGY